MAHISRSLLGLIECIFLFLKGLSAADLLCYSCFSLNYRSQVAPRNSPPPISQTVSNLSEVVSVIKRFGVAVPPLADGCPDVSLTSQPSFISVPRAICRGDSPFCAKLVFSYKGEKVVIRDCLSHLHLADQLNSSCLDDPRPFARLISNSTLCTCSHSLCNDAFSPYPLIVIVFICSIFF